MIASHDGSVYDLLSVVNEFASEAALDECIVPAGDAASHGRRRAELFLDIVAGDLDWNEAADGQVGLVLPN